MSEIKLRERVKREYRKERIWVGGSMEVLRR